MNTKLNRLMNDERGITALETAIILIAFVVVAAIFAFTVLTTGTYLTERSKEASYAGLQEVRGSMELRGSVIISGTENGQTYCGSGTVTATTATDIYFTVANVAGGQPVDLTDTGGRQVVNLTYRDKSQNVNLNKTTAGSEYWTVSFIGQNNGDKILEANELAQIHVNVMTTTSGLLSCHLGPNQTFGLEVKPPQGGVLLIERTTPAKIDSVTDLH